MTFSLFANFLKM
uniref:Uncharacterized protein n=1 Tax=Anguilla anguilla TaxID=7936 RepID=A0A0E9UCY1_ANGAN